MMKMRELIGPIPHQYGIISRVKPKEENIVSKNKKIQDERQIFIDEHKSANLQNLKINFLEESTKKSKMGQINRTVKEIMTKQEVHLFERRNRLRDLLLKEQQSYEEELKNSIISPLERAAQLREKAKQFKTIKETENSIFVQQKLDQKWRSECDELRTFQSKFLQSGMKDEHMRQIEEKIFREQKKMEEEAIFANLWYQDIQAKKEKEEREAAKQANKNREVSHILREQMLVLEKQKEDEKIIRAQNARLLQEKQNIDKLEKQMLFQKKREDQANRRQELDNCVKLKLINEARRAREELSYDLKALEDSLISFYNEDSEKLKKKHELMEEQRIYRDYLKAQYEEEKIREKELDRIMDEEVENQFRKKLNQWKAEKQARKDMLEKVIKERQKQINEKLLKNEERQRQLVIDKIEMDKLVEYYKQQEKQEKMEAIYKTKKYGNDLINQMEYLAMEKKLDKEQNQYEYENCIHAENYYQKRVNEAMQDMEESANNNKLNRFVKYQ